MNTLFPKIFLWFWATVILLGIALVLSFVLGPKGSYLPWQNTQWIANRVVREMDARGPAGASQLLRGLDQSHTLEACLFDESGTVIAGDHCETLRSIVRKPSASDHMDAMGGMNGMDGTKDWSVYRSLMTERDRQGRLYYLASQVYYGPQDAHRTIFGLFTHLGLLLVVSSAVCYLLTRQLTRPILRLRHASMEIAQGKLEARVDSSVERRGDEFGDLGREFNAMAARIQDLLSSQRQLISDVSHEVRSPLARMNLALDLARRRLGNDPAFDRLAIDIEKLNEMIGRLLTVAKLESGAVPTAFETIDLVRVLTEILEDAQMEATAHNCKIVFECDGDYQVPGDERLLGSAIENVIRNAVYYTHAGTEIRIALAPKAESGSDFVVLTVSDQGPGVPKADTEDIFKPFFRVAEARDRQSGGAGLGLAIASRVVKLHRGSILAVNRPEGGLEIRIELPTNGS